MNTLHKTLLAAVAAVTVSALPSEAHAAKIPIVYQTGEDIFVAGDGSLPKPFDEEPELAGAQSGYKCDIFGIMYAYFTISNCQPVAFKGDTFWSTPELAKAVEGAHPADTMQVGVWQKHGRWPLGLVLVGLIGFGLYAKVRGGDDDDE